MTKKRPAPSATEPAPEPQHSKKRRVDKAKEDVAPNPPSKRPKVIKLTPKRPFPNVPTSATATGPYSTRVEGNNMICVTRRVPLGAYLQRCTALVTEDGYVIRLFRISSSLTHAMMTDIGLFISQP